MGIELPGYEQIRGNTPYGTNYRVPNAPWRIVLHTVEGDPTSLASMRLTAKNHRYGPHLWVSPRLGAKIQTVPLDKSASALLHPSGTIETNHMKAIQVEQFGFASQTQDWDDNWVDWIGEHIIAPIYRAIGGAINLDYVEKTYGAGDGIVLATSSSPIRHNQATWAGCNWVTTHQRIIYNDHWDCGRFKLARALQAARETLGTAQPVDPIPTPPTDDGDLTVSEADRVIAHINKHVIEDFQARTDSLANRIDTTSLTLLSYMMNNQKTGVLYRVKGTTAPWYGLVGGRLIGPMDFEQAVEFKRQHEITENSIEIDQAWHDMYAGSFDVVTLSDKSVEDIANEVGEVNAQLLNGLPDNTDELAQKIAQQVVVQLGPNKTADTLNAIADALKQAAGSN